MYKKNPTRNFNAPDLVRIPENLFGALYHVLPQRRQSPSLDFLRRLAILFTHQMRCDGRNGRKRHVGTIWSKRDAGLGCRHAEFVVAAIKHSGLDAWGFERFGKTAQRE
jgi:hypothetical protein